MCIRDDFEISINLSPNVLLTERVCKQDASDEMNRQRSLPEIEDKGAESMDLHNQC